MRLAMLVRSSAQKSLSDALQASSGRASACANQLARPLPGACLAAMPPSVRALEWRLLFATLTGQPPACDAAAGAAAAPSGAPATPRLPACRCVSRAPRTELEAAAAAVELIEQGRYQVRPGDTPMALRNCRRALTAAHARATRFTSIAGLFAGQRTSVRFAASTTPQPHFDERPPRGGDAAHV